MIFKAKKDIIDLLEYLNMQRGIFLTHDYYELPLDQLIIDINVILQGYGCITITIQERLYLHYKITHGSEPPGAAAQPGSAEK